MEYETVIGLEVHVQLATESKIFCKSSTKYGAEPNSLIDPVTLGLPGALPVTNRKVVELALMLGIATECTIRKENRFARKHYFYPDLPKGYQISQFEEPICEFGKVILRSPLGKRVIGIRRIHMEEDAGKSIHDPVTGSTLVDLNRAGVPLLEIVSEPDIRSPAEASAYLKVIHQLVTYLEISDGNMDEGSFRCDANVSLRPSGSLQFGTRTEIKNINSFRFVEKALEYEVARQNAVLKSGQKIVQDTLLFNSETGETKSMRGKEGSADYRYFPDPDLPPLVIAERWISEVKAKLPKLPEERFKELTEVYGLSDYDSQVIVSDRLNSEYFDKVLANCKNPKLACNWVTSELFGFLKKNNLGINESPIDPVRLAQLVQLIDDNIISGKIGKSVFEEMWNSSLQPNEIISQKGLKQITDTEEILNIIKNIFDNNSQQLKSYLDGKENIHGFFVGQVMKATKGTANPQVVNDLVRSEANKRRNASIN
jgi:aspartyl-tRNA(Asn)/glutamyl-tRNA(Gln) amidotransferase subunit B